MEANRESLRGLNFDDLRNKCTTTAHPALIASKRESPKARSNLSSTNSLTESSPVPCFGKGIVHTFNLEIPLTMAQEQEAARTPLYPSQGRTQQPDSMENKPISNIPVSPQGKTTTAWSVASPQPEFGRPTILGSARTNGPVQANSSASLSGVRRHDPKNSNSYDHLFAKSRPKAPEFYKPPGSANPLQQIGNLKKDQQPTQILPIGSNQKKIEPVGPVDATSNHSRQQMSTNQATKISNDDVIIIPKPFNFPTQPFRAPVRQTFSSNQNTNPYYQTRTDFIDLTLNRFRSAHDDGFDDRQVFGDGRFGATDPYMYLDHGQAEENIKALLEGAMDVEDDKPRTRKKKRKQETKSKVEELSEQFQQATIGNNTGEQDSVIEDEEEEDDDDGTWEGLKVKLLPHQIEGVEWMRNKEMGTKKVKGILPKGGILADDMGLGKTIQSIALMLSNPKPSVEELSKSERKLDSKTDRSTLVVAPLALIKQWEAEIRDRVEPDHALKVRVHHGPQRTKSYKDLRKYDIVITTYQTLSSEHAEGSNTLKSALFGVNWYRIILDEAHSIKNRNAKSTKAACALNSEYRWCLTGTPMQNNLDELQSLIHFLRIKPYNDFNVWREQITKPMNGGRGGLSIQRLRAFLSAFMKRRTKDVLKQDGALGSDKSLQAKPTKGFQIVKRTVVEVEVEFSEQEQSFYKGLEARTDRSLELMVARNKLNYANALVLLMRLRQACNHPKLLGTDLAKEQDPGTRTPSRKGSKVNDMDDIANMLEGLSVEMKRCDICQIELDKKAVTVGQLRCDECEQDLQRNSRLMQKPKKHNTNNVRKVNRRIVLDSDEEDEGETKKQMIQRESQETLELEEDSEFDSDDSSDMEPDFASSAKIRQLIKILQKDSHTHKYIVFSFFTSMLNLIEPFMRYHHIKFVRYDGAMRNDMREASLESLRNDPTVRVLLCSLRAGSLGLNLTAASRVVILEPFWNPFVEEQAIDRVHRLNQTQDVIVHKLTIKDTIEKSILNLQGEKRELANATIEGQKGVGAGKLSLQEMLKLFRHDYTNDTRLDMIGMKNGNGLMERGDSTGQALNSQKSKGVGQTKKTTRPEDPIYGRRW